MTPKLPILAAALLCPLLAMPAQAQGLNPKVAAAVAAAAAEAEPWACSSARYW